MNEHGSYRYNEHCNYRYAKGDVLDLKKRDSYRLRLVGLGTLYRALYYSPGVWHQMISELQAIINRYQKEADERHAHQRARVLHYEQTGSWEPVCK
jgi:hypothetical protein